jgi:hypothetical protein
MNREFYPFGAGVCASAGRFASNARARKNRSRSIMAYARFIILLRRFTG